MYRVPRPVLAQYKKNIVCCGMVLELRVRAICELARPRGRGRARVRSVGRRNDPYIEESYFRMTNLECINFYYGSTSTSVLFFIVRNRIQLRAELVASTVRS
jgi:hypothetical protein